jgi:cytochrome d ubiquinol oxidase subunit II
MTPFFMGTVVGAIASGEVPAEGNGDAFSSWIGFLPLVTGALFVATGAYLAAVFLISDSRRTGDAEMEDYFARRALIAAVVAGSLAVVGIFALRADARFVYDGLTSDALPLVILSGLCGLAALVMLARGARRGLRPLAALAVLAVIWGWGVAQFPYLLPTSLKISEAAAPDPTLVSVLVVFGVAAVLILPSLGLLYVLSQRGMVGESPE